VSAAAPSAPLPDAIPMAAINGKRSSMSSAASPDYMRSMDEDDADPDQKLLEMAGYDHQNNKRSSSQTPGKPETEEEKRKNFLERNRQGEWVVVAALVAACEMETDNRPPARHTAALKCRQRKKAWLSQLQTKVDGLTSDNDRLKNIIQNLTDEVARMSAVLNSHRECPGMGQSLAQVGLSVIPGPPPPAPASQYHHPPPSAIIQPQQLAGQRAPQVNGTGGMMQTGFRQTSQGPVSASVMRPYAQQETTA
jgi:ATF/CREB family transcription factor